MGLAASTAFVERVDLFLHTLDGASAPYDTCIQCHGVMAIEVLEAGGQQEMYTLRCRHCGDTEQRTVVRYTLPGAHARDSVPV